MNAQALPALAGVHLAASTGDHEQLGALLQSGSANVNERHESGLYPLHLAVKGGRVKCVEILAARSGMQILNAIVQINGWPKTSLHMAVVLKENAVEIARCLINHGAEVNIAIDNSKVHGETPLHVASYRGSKELIELLLSKGAVISKAIKRGYSAWMFTEYGVPQCYAARGHNMAALKALIDFEIRNGTAPSCSDANEILCAMTCDRGSNFRLLKLAFEAYGDLVKRYDMGDTVLATLASLGAIESFKYLLSEGCRPLSVDANGDRRRRSLGEAIDYPSIKHFLPLMEPFLTPDVVSELNSRVLLREDEFPDAPIISVQNAGNIKSLEEVIRCGFTSNPPGIGIHFNDYFSFPTHRFWFSAFSGIYRDHTTIGYYITRCSITDEAEFLEQSVAFLLSVGARINPIDREIPPLVALMVKEIEPLKIGTCAWRVKEMIMKGVIQWNYRSSASTFKSPDLALFSALTGNTFILQRVFWSTGLDPVDLLTDLNEVDLGINEYHGYGMSGYSVPEYTRNCRKVRRDVGAAVLHMINTQISTASSNTIELCEQLDERYKWKMTNGESTLVDEEADEIWDLIHTTVRGVFRLKQMCRVTIRGYLRNRDKNLAEEIGDGAVSAKATESVGENGGVREAAEDIREETVVGALPEPTSDSISMGSSTGDIGKENAAAGVKRAHTGEKHTAGTKRAHTGEKHTAGTTAEDSEERNPAAAGGISENNAAGDEAAHAGEENAAVVGTFEKITAGASVTFTGEENAALHTGEENASSGDNESDLEAVIDQLPLPEVMRNYLKFIE